MDGIALLEELVAIPSPSGAEDALAEHLAQRMLGLGFRVLRDEVGNVIGEVGESSAGRTIVLLGHMDTVPGHIPVRREGGSLYGRGAVDAKGPLAAFVTAGARAACRISDLKVMVVGAVEEETRSRGAHHLARAMTPPDGVIIGEPGGWQGITLGYKGSLQVHYRLTRPAGHGAGNRSTPAEEAVAFWREVVQLSAEQNNERRPPRFDTLDPTLRSITTGGDGLEDWAEMSIGLRVPVGADEEALQGALQERRNGAEVTFPYSEPPFQAGKNTCVVRALLLGIRASGGRPRFKLKTGTSDMNVVGPAWRCPIAAYGPGDSSLDHTPDEHIDLDEFRRAVDVLTKALAEF